MGNLISRGEGGETHKKERAESQEWTSPLRLYLHLSRGWYFGFWDGALLSEWGVYLYYTQPWCLFFYTRITMDGTLFFLVDQSLEKRDHDVLTDGHGSFDAYIGLLSFQPPTHL